MKLHEVLSKNDLAAQMELVRNEMHIPKPSFKYTPDGTISIKYATLKGGKAIGISEREDATFHLVKNGKLAVKFDTIEVAHTDRNPLNGSTSTRHATFMVYFCGSLLNLEGLPKKFVGSLDIRSNRSLVSLEGAPKNVEGSMWVHGNHSLKSLKGLPNVMKGELALNDLDGITELDYLPNFFTGSLKINSLKNMNSLVGIEKKLTDNFSGSLEMQFSLIKEGGIGLVLIKGLKQIKSYFLEEMPEPFNIIQKYIGKPDQLFDCQAELIDAGFEEYAKL